jgi:hypothetical protein
MFIIKKKQGYFNYVKDEGNKIVYIKKCGSDAI